MSNAASTLLPFFGNNVAGLGNKVECCFDKVERSLDNVACCFDIVADVDGAKRCSCCQLLMFCRCLPAEWCADVTCVVGGDVIRSVGAVCTDASDRYQHERLAANSDQRDHVWIRTPLSWRSSRRRPRHDHQHHARSLAKYLMALSTQSFICQICTILPNDVYATYVAWWRCCRALDLRFTAMMTHNSTTQKIDYNVNTT